MQEIHAIYVIYKENKKLKTLISPFFDKIEYAADYFKNIKIKQKSLLYAEPISVNASNSIMKIIKHNGSLIPIIRYEEEIFEDGFYNSYEAAFIDNNYKKHSKDKNYFQKEFKNLLDSFKNNKFLEDYFHLNDEDIIIDANYLYFNHYRYNKNDVADLTIPEYLNDCIWSFYDVQNNSEGVDFTEDGEFEVHLDNTAEINFDKNFFNNFHMDMNRSFFYLNNPDWIEFANIIDQLLLRKDLYYIVENSKSKEQGTFGEDNKASLYSFLNNNLKFYKDSEFLIIITQFTNIQAIDSNLPVKRAAAALFHSEGFNLIEPELVKETLNESRPDNLKNKNDLKCMHMNELLSFLKIKID